MPIHSNILVHWTGSHIEESSAGRNPLQYVELLADDCEHGLYMKRTTEDAIRRCKSKHVVRLCFTEIRLSQAKTHAKRYGTLGIGFARDFIMKKGGRPVIYIPFKTDANGRLLEDCIRNIYVNSKHDEDIRRWSKWIIAHVKRMSSEHGEDFFKELEWRLVYDESDSNPHFRKAGGKGIFRMPFRAHDVKIIVFPDENVRQMAFKDARIRAFFAKGMPSTVTLNNCPNF